ncbi:hypothetical protein Tco_0038058 [Tanacetum coccineum]
MPFPRFTKFVRIGEDYQEYGLLILETMLIEAIKQYESYQMFIKYSTCQIPPKKSRGKGSQIKKTADDFEETVDVSEEFEPEPEPLGKSISKTEAEEAKAARQVHATHARIGVPSSTREEQEAIDIMQALKESKKTSKRQPGTRGSREGTGTIPGVLDEFTVVSATSSEGTRSKQESEYSKEDKFDDEEKDDKEGDADDEDVETESDEDDIYKYKIRDKDEEMLNAKVEDSDKGDEEVTDAAKADAEKTSEVKDDAKKTKLPLTSSSLSISSVTVSTLPPPSVFTTQSVPQQTTTSIPTPPIITDAPIITTAISESDALFTIQLRVAKLETYVSGLKKIDLFAEDLASLKTQVPSLVDNYLGYKVGDLPKKQTPTVDLEQESEKTPSKILKIKKEHTEKKKMSKFIVSLKILSRTMEVHFHSTSRSAGVMDNLSGLTTPPLLGSTSIDRSALTLKMLGVWQASLFSDWGTNLVKASCQKLKCNNKPFWTSERVLEYEDWTGAVADNEDGSIMPPRRFKKKSVRKIVEKRVAKAIEKYEKTRADSNNTGGSGSTNTRGTVCTRDAMDVRKRHLWNGNSLFQGTEGVVGTETLYEKMEQVFEICKCAEDDKVKFAMCTFEGRALTWWNRNVQTLGLANANQIPWSNVKAMMTTEYCPATEI